MPNKQNREHKKYTYLTLKNYRDVVETAETFSSSGYRMQTGAV